MIPFLDAIEPTAFTSTASGVASYVPYVQGVCYAIAACIAVVTAYVIYNDMQNDRGNLQGKLVGCIGSILFFISAALFIPDVFGVSTSTSGSLANDYKYGITGKTSDGLLNSEVGGIPQTGLITEIPETNSSVWINALNSQGKFPFSGAKVDDFYLYADYVSTSKGDLNKVQSRIYADYKAGKIDSRTYQSLTSFAMLNGHVEMPPPPPSGPPRPPTE